MSRARLALGEGASALPVLVAFTPGPRSFTGEDVLEIQAPGNPALLERLVQRVLAVLRQTLGTGRLAEAGEFTRRAFTAGRIDLTRAEGIAATISAVSDAQLRAAAMLRTGRLGRWATRLVEELGQALALVEAGIDFIDQEDVVAIGPADLDDRLAGIAAEVEGLLAQSRSFAELEALPWVVLAGEPNAGKSTLFNALLGRTRAVTSDVAGTTRDVLSEPLTLGDAEVMLVDIAGLDAPRAALDRAMQQAAREAIDRAEVLLLLSDSDAFPLPPRADVPVIRVRTKCDTTGDAATGGADIAISAHTGAGLAELRDRVAGAVGDRAVTLAGQMLALQPRHRDELVAARDAIAAVRQMLAPQREQPGLDDMELVAERMRLALDHLGAIGGQMTADDVLGKVFSTFCVGK